MQCPHCAGAGRYVPLNYVTKSLVCPRCHETGEVTPESEDRRARLNGWLRSMTVLDVAQRLGRREWEVAAWSIGQREIPEGVL